MNLADLVKKAGGSCVVQGLYGSSKGWFFSKWQEFHKRPVLVVTQGPHEAEAWQDDLKAFCKDESKVSYFPECEDGAEITLGILESIGERWSILEKPPVFLVTTLKTFEYKVIPPERLKEIRTEIRKGLNIGRDSFLKWLVDNGYDRTDCVEYLGEFSHRGGIVDVFPPNSGWPVRLEFLGNTIESIRAFNPQTQCSVKDMLVPEFVYPVDEQAVYKKFKDELVRLDQFMPVDCMFILDEINEDVHRDRIILKELVTDQSGISVDIQSLVELGVSPGVTAPRSPDMVTAAREKIFEEISRWIREDYSINIFCNNEGEKKRLDEWLGDKNLRDNRKLFIDIARISNGFVFPEEKLVVISDEEIFNRYKIRLPKRKFKGYGVPVREFTELQAGDYVVHIDHGIGKYLGIQIEKDREMIVIAFANNAKLYVPVKDAYLLERYMGLGGRPPKLSILGGKRWLGTKIKVERALADVAGELLELQAKRKALKGISFSPDKPWLSEMEDSFIYEETEDQLKAINEVKQDMVSSYPMDRLICGDVGYGKTEVAVRAAFKAVLDAKQAVVLVPTTILAQQHYRTFSDRLADYPVVVEMLSRFRDEKQQRDIVKGIREGKIDIVIGTHRLLQQDIKFKDLGLVIIDEEQRFGVRHKEQLKKLRELVDVITMTATPIPRTLYMSLAGLRDMSIINTPPQERLAVKTIIADYDEQIIRNVILREIEREGQVYFLHNRVETIDRVTDKLQKLVPEAKFLTAHGRMDEELLALVMDEFVEDKADVLVCTTIIQSGLDIPNVNTIIIDNADMFGLADLYQLRGRVGRYKHQAYAYLMLSKRKLITGDAKKRLKAIQDFSHLGAGFKIAMQDLEIRGAGNLLGLQQSGFIHAVGFDMYCKLLKRNILKLEGKAVEEPYEVVLIGFNEVTDAQIPVDYIPSERIRIDFYKRISSALDVDELDELEREMGDRFGSIPESVKQLLDIARIKLFAIGKEIKEIEIKDKKIYITRLDGKRKTEDLKKDKINWLKKEICSIIP